MEQITVHPRHKRLQGRSARSPWRERECTSGATNNRQNWLLTCCECLNLENTMASCEKLRCCWSKSTFHLACMCITLKQVQRKWTLQCERWLVAAWTAEVVKWTSIHWSIMTKVTQLMETLNAVQSAAGVYFMYYQRSLWVFCGGRERRRKSWIMTKCLKWQKGIRFSNNEK